MVLSMLKYGFPTILKPTGISHNSPAAYDQCFYFLFFCFYWRDKCTSETVFCSTLQDWISICKNEQIDLYVDTEVFIMYTKIYMN